MHARRLLFIRGRSGLAPIVAALASLVALVLLGLVIALWPPGPKKSSDRPMSSQPVSGDRSIEGGMHISPKAREAPGRTRGI
jgi:hypothetical protein